MNFLKLLNVFFSALIIVLSVAIVFIFVAPSDDGFAQDIVPKKSAPVENITKAPAAPTGLTHLPAFQIDGLGSTDLADDVMIVSFFSMWCADCQRENVLYNDFIKKYNIPLYGINVYKKQADSAQEFFKAYGNPYKKWGKDDFRLMSRAIKSLKSPSSMIVTPDLKIHWRYDGELTNEVIETQMLPILKELAAPRSILSLTHLPVSNPQTGLPHSEPPQ